MSAGNRWDWACDELLSFNLIRGRSVDDVLRCYGADPSQARTLRRRESDEAFGPPHDKGTVLRAGRAGDWSFCMETWWFPAGSDLVLLRRLSEGTDAIHYFRNLKGGRSVRHVRDGRTMESFELGMEPLAEEETPLGLHRAFEQLAAQRAYGDDGHDEIWCVLSEVTGVPLDTTLVNGPLPTIMLQPGTNTHRSGEYEPPAPATGRPGLGPRIGELPSG
ncbi:DUF6461 domain-containing protein [Streptomyces uncialis]|uniref:DUF6461 domain-containing protein n=1 Tax=Streptomyces uncialis TaxID=1048205 RepID=UPI002E3011D5|nr:DUF6461 domain-containing protein [Streptomyces uncialis]